MNHKMDNVVKAWWLEALRGDEFTQGTRFLRADNDNDPEGHCCLGVLCELHRRRTGDGQWVEATDSDGRLVYEYRTSSDKSETVLPIEVSRWAGLDGSNPSFIYPENEDYVSLANLNDQGSSFKRIADLIESEF
jgi:hypothetical protein